jgi:hypothetical protein
VRNPPLKFLHSDELLSKAKLAEFERLTTEQIKMTLAPGQKGCLKARPDGMVLDGHHRIYILRARGEDIDSLPREIVAKTEG